MSARAGRPDGSARTDHGDGTDHASHYHKTETGAGGRDPRPCGCGLHPGRCRQPLPRPAL